MPVTIPPSCVELAALQAGVLSRRQALEDGMAPDAIDRQLRYGYWQSLHRGVYAVYTGSPTREAKLWAALHRAGPGAVLSHHTAAELYKVVDRPSPEIHVSIPERRRVEAIQGVVLHRSRRLDESMHHDLRPPRTRLDETVLDVVSQAAYFDQAFSIVCAACQRRLVRPSDLVEAIRGRSKLRWRVELVRALCEVEAGAHSFLEYRYLHRVERRHSLPTATRQAGLADGARRRYLDNLYDEFRVCVELDGLQAHPEDRRWQDLHRINAITAQGIVTLRYGWSDIEYRPCRTAAQIGEVLSQRGWTGQPRACAPRCAVRP
jgi:hypothetical protein